MRSRVALALGIVYLVWGSTYLFIRWMVQEVPPLAAGGLRFLLAGSVFLVLGRAVGGGTVTWAQVIKVAAVGALLVGVSNGLVGIASRDVQSSLTALLLASMPLWLTFFDSVRPGGQRPAVRTLVGLAAGFVGTAFLVWKPVGGVPVSKSAMALILLAAMVWAGGSLIARGIDRPKNWMVTAGLEMLGGGVAQLVVGGLRGELGTLAASNPSPRALFSFVYLVVVGSWLGYGAFSWLLRNARPSISSTYAYVNPLVAVVLGATIADEPLTWRTGVAGAIIIGSVTLVTTARARG